MFSLQLFGGASIQREGEPLHGPVAQRRRLGLLALLATPSCRSLSRDKLIGYLWPESDTERARRLLSEALYVIRKALGEGAVLAAGDELRLDPAVVLPDVTEFERALAQQEYERAITLYRGAFLDGFFLPDAAEFERWAEQERARLASCQQRALETVARQRREAGDLQGAAGAWRQLAQSDPYNSRVALQLMRALAEAGDRAGALQHARVHVTLFREEFQAEPDREIVEYAEQLRNEPPAVPGPEVPSAPSEGPGRVIRDDAPQHTLAEALTRVEAVEPCVPAGQEQEAQIAVAPVRERIGSRAAGGSRPPRPRGSVYAGIGYAAIAAAVALIVTIGVRSGTARGPAAPAEQRAVAVLPFVDMSADRTHEWFGDGLAEELIGVLARLEDVRVAARTSAFAFRGKDVDIREIGRQLGVEYVVEGSVRVAGNQLRVAAQLISAEDGYHVWTEVYNTELTDIFGVQDALARSILGALQVQLSSRSAPPPIQPATHDLDAYYLYLQGRYYWNKRTPAGLARGMELFRAAVERDPAYARAHAGLADSFALLVTLGALAPREGYSQARAAAERALALDSTLAEAHSALALVKLYHDHDWDGADAAFRRASALSPGYITGRQWYSHFLACRGQLDAALAQVKLARELDPLSLPVLTAEGTLYRYARRHAEAIELFQSVLDIESTFWLARSHLAAVHVQQGTYAEAIAEAEEAQRHAGGHPLPTALLGYAYARAGRHSDARGVVAALEGQARQHYLSPAYLAVIHAALGDRDRAFVLLDEAYEARDDWMVYLRAEPAFDPLRGDPRFDALVARVGS